MSYPVRTIEVWWERWLNAWDVIGRHQKINCDIQMADTIVCRARLWVRFEHPLVSGTFQCDEPGGE